MTRLPLSFTLFAKWCFSLSWKLSVILQQCSQPSITSSSWRCDPESYPRCSFSRLEGVWRSWTLVHLQHWLLLSLQQSGCKLSRRWRFMWVSCSRSRITLAECRCRCCSSWSSCLPFCYSDSRTCWSNCTLQQVIVALVTNWLAP